MPNQISSHLSVSKMLNRNTWLTFKIIEEKAWVGAGKQEKGSFQTGEGSGVLLSSRCCLQKLKARSSVSTALVVSPPRTLLFFSF